MDPKGVEIGFFVMLGILVIASIWCVIAQERLSAYLLSKHTNKWKELTTVLRFGPGIANPRKGLKFLYSDEDFGDPEVMRLKVAVRRAILYVVTGIGAVFISFVMLAFVWGTFAGKT